MNTLDLETIQNLIDHISQIATEHDILITWVNGLAPTTPSVCDGKNIILMNINYRPINALPFILCHEIAHCLHQDGRYLTLAQRQNINAIDYHSEGQANQLALELLLKAYKKSFNQDNNEINICSFMHNLVIPSKLEQPLKRLLIKSVS